MKPLKKRGNRKPQAEDGLFRKLGMGKYLSVFLGVQLILFTAEMIHPVRDALIIPFTAGVAEIAAWLINLIDSNVVSYDTVIQDKISGFAVKIDAGCNGVEPIIVYTAAVVAFPATLASKGLGIIAGALAIQGMNILRVISLFYLGQWDEVAFNWAHLYLWQALIILDALIVWMIWVRFSGSRVVSA